MDVPTDDVPDEESYDDHHGVVDFDLGSHVGEDGVHEYFLSKELLTTTNYYSYGMPEAYNPQVVGTAL